MPKMILTVSTGVGRVGLTSISLGLVRALRRGQVRVGFSKPIAQPRPGDCGPERSTALAELLTGVKAPAPLGLEHAEARIANGEDEVLMEEVYSLFEDATGDAANVIVVEGLVPTDHVYATQINLAMARALGAQVVIVGRSKGEDPKELGETFEIAARTYTEALGEEGVLGVVLNKAPTCSSPRMKTPDRFYSHPLDADFLAAFKQQLAKLSIRCLGVVPDSPALGAPRVREIAEATGAVPINEGNTDRRVRLVCVAAMQVENAVDRGMKPGSLIIVPGDRSDNLLAACMVSLSGVQLSGIILCGGIRPPQHILDLCGPAMDQGLPVFLSQTSTFETARSALSVDLEVPIDDRDRAELVMNTVANGVDIDGLTKLLAAGREANISPPAFRHMLIQRARAASKRVVLPEGDEPRTVQAACICAAREIATCVLLGSAEKIRAVARKVGADIEHPNIEIIDPTEQIERYVPELVELRRHKGMHPAAARDVLEDNVWLGTMMLKLGHVDGLVSGAVHTTANTIRPALQVIKMAPGSSLVSSVFFMLLPNQVLVYGDCAVNPDPDAQALADIAIQSAESAEFFGLPARVAMISYSTGTSGAGADVEKVARAVELARDRRPELLIDGPLQYDAAYVESVGRKKAPDSLVAGRANVFVFPDLNTGNTTYKAVQRSAGVVSIGPMLQGLAMPVNDLSRGALVEDIVFTVALTAIQAEQVAHRT